MVLANERLYSEVETLPQEFVQEVLNYIMYLKYKQNNLAFSMPMQRPSAELMEAINDVENNRNIIGPFATAEDAVRSMLED
ncbi:MAG: DUF2281 domain-containing protein [Chitinivibrionia bacterium]|nr:DUF2281 domain-containing protein [Chitinivibrionia bacterium]